MEDTDIDEEVFDAAVCPECTKMTEHEILRRNVKGNGEDLLVRCVICSNVHNLQLRPPKSVFIKTTLSDRMDSELSLDYTSRECRTLNAGEISAMWAVRVDRTIVPITMTEGEISVPSSIECEPDRIFSCGAIMQMNGKRWRIRALHTGKGRTLNGKRIASEIRRIYLHVPDDHN